MYVSYTKIIFPEKRNYDTTTINGSISSNVGVCVLSSMLSTTITHTSLFSMLTVGKLIVYNRNCEPWTLIRKNKNNYLATDLSYILILWYYAFLSDFFCVKILCRQKISQLVKILYLTQFLYFIFKHELEFVVHGLKHSVLSDHKSQSRTVTP